MIENKRILIIGGAGFIGTAITEQLYEKNEVVVADICDFNKSSLHLAGLDEKPFIRKVCIDATNKDEVINLGEDFDYIIHATAILGIHKVVEHSVATIDTNYSSCKNALELARRQKHLIKFLSFSTSEVYGRNVVDAQEDKDMSVGPAYEARWCYAASKIVCEHLIAGYSREYNVPSAIIRPFNVFGENRIGSNAMSSFLFKAMLNEKITIDGDGSQVRAWCHISDFVQGVIRALESNINGESYNIGNPDNVISILKLAGMIKEIVGSQSEIIVSNVYVPDVKNRTLSIDKAIKQLGYNPRIDLEKGICRMYKWASKLDRKLLTELL